MIHDAASIATDLTAVCISGLSRVRKAQLCRRAIQPTLLAPASPRRIL